MKLQLPVTLRRAIMACAALCAVPSHAATYTDLTTSWCDRENNVIYDGQGYFAVESDISTSVDLTISLSSLYSYVNSNDYSGSSYMLLWDSVYDYGLGDNADVSVETGSRTPYLTGYSGGAWSTSNQVTYETLSQYATDDSVTLYITNSNSSGVNVSVKNADGESVSVYSASALKSSSNSTLSGYYVNLNYVTAVTLNTTSGLDTDSYVPPTDYSQPFVSERTDGTTVGRLTFLGDSITHGVSDMSYRWQFFKILTDNGIENQIAGPREGYYSTPTTSDYQGTTTSYGGVEFDNVHLAQASGRTHNIITGSTSATIDGVSYSSGVNYGGNSTSSTAAGYDSNTWICMMGTNDMLSDSGSTTDDYCSKMAKMLGGTVTYTDGAYQWTADADNRGTMGTIVSDVCGEGDVFYMLSITPWTNHANSNTESYHFAAQEFNRNLEAWVETYAAETGTKVVYVDVTRGMVDVTSDISFYGPGAFFRSPGTDGLHPSEQGSLIMAGNLARGMGIAGRTAGLNRADASTSGTTWASADVGSLSAGSCVQAAENAFSAADGYTVDVSAVFGNGSADGWLGSDSTLSISVGDGTNSGTLNLSEGYIMWGTDILYCQDNSLTDNETLRIVWHNGNVADNVLQGYYVWLGDMLIGQGLSAVTGTELNGISISAAGADGAVTALSWTDTAYAPTTTLLTSTENAYITTQDAVTETIVHSESCSHSAAATLSGIDYTDITGGTANATALRTSSSAANLFRQIGSAANYVGLTGTTDGADCSLLMEGTIPSVFGALNGAAGGNLTVEIADGAVVSGGSFSGVSAGVIGTFMAASADSFNVFINGGSVSGNGGAAIVGGGILGSGNITATRIVVNDGTITGDILGGSYGSGASGATVGRAAIEINGGTIDGNIVAGGTDGSIGNTEVLIKGGIINGNITKGTATRTAGAAASVIVEGSAACITGNIEADTVTIRNLTETTAHGFDRYSGTISTTTLVLDNVTSAGGLRFTLTGTESIRVCNASNTSIVVSDADRLALSTLQLDADTTFGVFADASRIAETAHEATLSLSTLTVTGQGATLNANIVLGQGALLALNGNTLNMGSTVELTGITVDDTTLNAVLALNEGDTYVLFTGVDALTLNGTSLAYGDTVTANTVITNEGLSSDYVFTYTQADGGSVGIRYIPEPATATLSLLALAALAARRRRR